MPQSNAAAVLGTAVCLFFAACVGTGEPASGPSATVEPEPGTGIIMGSVVDTSLAPLEAAQVGILSLGRFLNTTTDGSFRFDNVPPGRYEVGASKLGYESSVSSVEVIDGVAATRTFTLDTIPIREPYHEILTQRGSFGCGVAYRPQQAGIVGASVCGAITVLVGQNQVDKFLLLWDLVGPYDGWMGAAYEMEWTTTQAFGSGLWVRFETNNCAGSLDSQFTSLRGKSPLREVQNATTVAEKLERNEKSSCGSADECGPESCTIMSRVFPHTEVLGPSYPADIGVTIQQPFTQYFSQFFHGEPSSEFSALVDG